jgi:hypothetical protein
VNADDTRRKSPLIPRTIIKEDGDGHGCRGDRHVQLVLDQDVQSALSDNPRFIDRGGLAVPMNQLLEQLCDPGGLK